MARDIQGLVGNADREWPKRPCRGSALARRLAATAALCLAVVACGAERLDARPGDARDARDGLPADAAAVFDAQGDAADAVDEQSPPAPDATFPPADWGAPDTPATADGEGPPLPPLVVEHIQPDHGPAAGGTLVTVRGQGFTAATRVFLGPTELADPFVLDDRYINGQTPPGPGGPAVVRVERPDDGAIAELPAGFRYEETAALLAIEPAAGPVAGGTPFVLRGAALPADAVVVVGGRLAIAVARLDAATLTGVTPPGREGPADVTVLGPRGRATLEAGFRYRAPLAVHGVEPAVGTTAGDEWVFVRGAGFAGALRQVFFAGLPALVDGGSATLLRVRTPAHPPGGVPVRVVVDGAAVEEPAAFAYVDPAPTGAPLELWAVIPPAGPLAGGNEVTVALSGVDPTQPLTVRFGSAELSADGAAAAGGALRLVVPPATAPGAVDVEAFQPVGLPARLPAGYRYDDSPFAVAAVEPAAGPAAGGSAITIRGRGFAAGAAVVVGALEAPAVTVADPFTLHAETPPGSPGPADVTVRLDDGREATLPAGFSYTSAARALLAVQPARAAQAGGTRIELLGVGFPERPQVVIGGRACTAVERLSDTRLTAVTPRHDVGLYDVAVHDGPLTLALAEAFTIFEPANSRGGTWGDPILGAANVTVLESGTGNRLAGVFVVLGADVAGPFAGYTDDRGQITFSGPDLFGPVEVHATKPGYSGYSVVHYDAQNVTFWLNRRVPPGTGGGGTSVPLVPGRVGGRVINAEKYMAPPPVDCQDRPLSDAPFCAPCDAAGPCPAGFECWLFGSGKSYCTLPCTASAECPFGYVCLDTGPTGQRCMPMAGEAWAECRIASSSVFGGGVDPGPFATVNQHHNYLIETSLGEVAIYCRAGYRDPATGRVVPLAMGVRRHVFVQADDVSIEEDVVLDIPLTRTVRLVPVGLPEHPTGTRTPTLYIGLDLGSDGVIPVTGGTLGDLTELADDGRTILLRHQPAELSGALYDAAYAIYATVLPAGPLYEPSSMLWRPAVRDVADTRMLVRAADGSWSTRTSGIDGGLRALWGNAAGLWGIGLDGRVYAFAAQRWSGQPVPSGAALFAIHGLDPENLWAVGAAGRAVRFDGFRWTDRPTGQPTAELRAVHVVAPDRVVAASADGQVLLFDGTGWAPIRASDGLALTALWAFPSGAVVAAGPDAGLWSWDGFDWVAQALPEGLRPRAIHFDEAGTGLVVGAGGRACALRAGLCEEEATGTQSDLLAVVGVPGGSVVAVGADGVLLERSLSVWQPRANPAGNGLPLLAVAAAPDRAIVAAGVHGYALGPFMGYPFFSAPAPEGGRLDDEHRVLAWSAGGLVEPQYNQVYVSDASGYPFWTLIVDGPVTRVVLPRFASVMPEAGFPTDGSLRVSVTRAEDVAFAIDRFRMGDLGTFDRTTWAIGSVSANTSVR